MDRNKINLLLQTVINLKLKQIYYQLYYLIRKKLFKRNYEKELKKDIRPLIWNVSFFYPNSFARDKIFTFLNLEYNFENKIDWNYAENGKLWTYNLNYFDFLNQETITIQEGLLLIKNYIENDIFLKDGKEPYPISLRGINWVKFLSKHAITDVKINQVLYNHYQTLIHNLEYHLLGNHLLENGFSLLFGAYYFKDDILYKKAKLILLQELKEQILKDGAHFELSPMYHQIILHRLLDCINLIKANPWIKDIVLFLMEERATRMLSWLQTVTYTNGDIPMVNDSAYTIAPKSHQLFEYAKSMGIEWKENKLSDSGYRKFKTQTYELFVDVGNIGPDYQPGHGHSDTFSFELYVNDTPIIVDTGISTYEKNKIRLNERQTSSHNTVKYDNKEQTKVWDGFRVAQRAKIINLSEDINQVTATHDGYKKSGTLHTRSFYTDTNYISIKDILSKESNKIAIAFFHFHPNIKILQILNKEVHLVDQKIHIKFNKEIYKIEQHDYQFATGFNKRANAKKIKVYFNTTLSTTINL